MISFAKNHKRLLLGAGVVCCFAGGMAISSVSGASGAATPFDPVKAALGVDSAAEVSALQAAQVDLAERLPQSAATVTTDGGTKPMPAADAPPVSDEAQHELDVVHDWEAAIDELYEAVASDPDAEAGRQAWVTCMSNAGTPYASPMAVEEDILSVNPPENVDAIVQNRDQCNEAGVGLVDSLVREAYPEWQATHGAIIDDYRAVLGL